MSKRPLIIVGASGHGRVVSDIAVLNGYTQIAFLDDADVPGMPIIGKVSEFETYLETHDFFVGIGNNAVRRRIFELMQRSGANMVSLCHPNAVIGSNVQLGKGVAVMAGAVINNGTRIENGAIINTCSSVDHDCRIGAFVHVSVGAHLAGTVTVGEETFIGAGVTVINNVSISKSCMIGAGGVVIKDIHESGTYIGVPVKGVL